MPNPRTKYKGSKNVFSVTCIALSCVHICARLLQPLAQSLIGSPGTLAGTACSVEDETRARHDRRNPECLGDFSQIVEIDKLKFIGISRYKFKLRF